MTYSYGRNPKLYEQMLNNEKKNFKIFHEKVSCEKTRGRPHSYYFIRDVTKFKLVLSLELDREHRIYCKRKACGMIKSIITNFNFQFQYIFTLHYILL